MTQSTYFDVLLLLRPSSGEHGRNLPESGNDSAIYTDLQTILSSRMTLSGFSSLSPQVASSCCHTEVPLQLNEIIGVRHSLRDFEIKYNADVVVLPTHPLCIPSKEDWAVRPLKLAVFDMDSTLIEQEVIDELARSIGVYDKVSKITESAMRGERDFATSLKDRVALLKGLNVNVWDDLKKRITFTPGASDLCRALKKLGVKMAVLSGGFTPLAEWVKSELGLDVVHANFLETSPATEEVPFPHLTGKLMAGKPIVTAALKKELLLGLAKQYQVPLSETLCVGDGANDLEMLGAVGDGNGVAIAFNAKPKVQVAAPNKLNSRSLSDILYLLGYTTGQIDDLVEL